MSFAARHSTGYFDILIFIASNLPEHRPRHPWPSGGTLSSDAVPTNEILRDFCGWRRRAPAFGAARAHQRILSAKASSRALDS
jgi:hypothetical protein